MKDLSFRTKFYLAVGLQLVLLLGLLGFRQFTLLTGQRVWLKTVPVDPRDMFRGDYVTLSYEISRLPDWRLGSQKFARGGTVFVSLRRQGRFWNVDSVSSEQPEDERLFIRGKARNAREGGADWRAGAPRPELGVEYGIESYFVPEGEGKSYEAQRGAGLAVEVAVDRYGRAAIRRVEVLPGTAPGRGRQVGAGATRAPVPLENP